MAVIESCRLEEWPKPLITKLLHHSFYYSIVLYSKVQFNTVLYSTVQYNTKHNSITQYNTVQYKKQSTHQCSSILYPIVEYSKLQYLSLHQSDYSAIRQVDFLPLGIPAPATNLAHCHFLMPLPLPTATTYIWVFQHSWYFLILRFSKFLLLSMVF